MRIAMLAPFGLQPKGTVSARMLPLAQALARRGHMIRLVIPPWDDPSAPRGGRAHSTVEQPPNQAGEEALSGLHTVILPLPTRFPSALALTRALVSEALYPSRTARATTVAEGGTRNKEAVAALASFRPQVVHVFKPVGYSGLAGLALSGLRVPWVLDTDDWEGPGGWADANPYSHVQKWAVTVQEALLPRLAGAVTVASRTLEGRAWSFGLPRRCVFYLPNGVWQEKYASWLDVPRAQTKALRARYSLTEGKTILLYTRFAEYPPSWPLDVLSMVIQAHPDARLLAVGNGFFGEEHALSEEAARRGLQESVVSVGRVSERELPSYLALGDVALYPMEDNLLNRSKSPVKVLEPMLMGLPVVAHSVGQAAEFVGGAGVLVEPGDLRGMAAATAALLADPERRRALGAAARNRVWTLFNWETLSATAERAYRQALRGDQAISPRSGP